MVPQSSASGKINVAVVGLGFMGVTHLRAYEQLRQARVVAVCDTTRLPVNGVVRGVNGNIQRSAAIRLGSQVRGYRAFAEVLADRGVDLVDLCTPTALHAGQAIAALKAGKHVLCEKPLARTAAEARKVFRMAEASRRHLMPAMCMRFWPGWDWLKSAVAGKTYGKVLAAHFGRVSEMPSWGRPGTYDGGKDTGGALFDLHIHDTDFINFLFGRPESVFSTGVTGFHGAINHVATQYVYPNGPAVHAEGSWLMKRGFNMAFMLHCERATITYDLSRGRDALRVDVEGEKSRTRRLDGSDGYRAEIRYFLDCLLRGRNPRVVTARDAVTALEICEAEEKSLRSGKIVQL